MSRLYDISRVCKDYGHDIQQVHIDKIDILDNSSTASQGSDTASCKSNSEWMAVLSLAHNPPHLAVRSETL